MKKNVLTNIIRTICFLLVFLVVFGVSYKILERKGSAQKRAPFYEEKENYDVLFLGTSLVINGIFPMELYEDYGIASYNCAGHAELLPVNYWNLVNALEYTTPKLVVVDVFTLKETAKVYETDLSYLHSSLDAMPLSKIKYEAVSDLVPEGRDKWEYLFDFIMYHSRWGDLKSEDFHVTYNREKGAESRMGTIYSDTPKLIGGGEYEEMATYGVEYLEKIIQLCKEKNIEVLIINMPYTGNNQRCTNYAQVLADKYDVNFCNMMQQEGIINYSTDLCDGNFHLNPSGARKVTKYLGQYIKENYEVPDRRVDEIYASWEEDYLDYRNLKYGNLKSNASNIYNYLSLLYDEKMEYSMYVSNKNGILKDSNIVNLLNNLNIEIDAKMIDNPNAFLVVSSSGLKVKQWKDNTQINEDNLYFEINVNEDGVRTLEWYLGSNSVAKPIQEQQENLTDMQIVVWDEALGKVIDNVCYTCPNTVNITYEMEDLAP